MLNIDLDNVVADDGDWDAWVQQAHEPDHQIPHAIVQEQQPMEVIDLNIPASMDLTLLSQGFQDKQRQRSFLIALNKK
jgi:hypothetical protein